MGNGNTFRVVSPEIVEQIDLARRALQGRPEFDLIKRHQVYSCLRCEAVKHSIEMEVGNGKKIRRGRARKLAEKNLKIAADFFQRNYAGELIEDLIKSTAFLVEPDIGIPSKYRDTSGVMAFSSDGAVYPRKHLEAEMALFLQENRSLPTYVGRAFHSHFHIARIHPFRDGNGRLARLVQNGILDYEGLPPVIIENYERNAYLELLRVASESYRVERCLKPEQISFYNYLATKLLGSLNAANKKLAEH